jgi:SSS family solute:Na+ symporter
MPRWSLVFAVTLVYLAASLVMGLLGGRRTSRGTEGFVAGDRTLGLFVMYFITGATIFSAFAFLGGPGWSYSRGAAAFYILAYGTVGMVPLWFLGPRSAELGRRHGYVTQGELVADRFESGSLSVILALVSLVAFVPYLTLQMKGAGYVLSTVTEGRVPEWAGGGLAYLVVVVYVFASGVMGVGWTNTFQGIFMMILAWVLGLYLPTHLYGGVGEMFRAIAAERPEMLTAPGLTSSGQPWSWGGFSSAVLVSVLGFSVWPHLFMKSFTARDEKTLRRTIVLYPTFQLFLVPILLIGFAGILRYAGAVESPDEILPHIVMDLDLPAVIVGLFCAGALAASMSSGDAIVHAAASITVKDFFRILRPGTSDLDLVRLMRLLVMVVAAVAYLLSIVYQGSLVLLLLGAYGAVVQIFPLLFSALYWPRANRRGALSGLIAGCAVTTFFVLFPQLRPLGIHHGILGLVANVAALVGVSLATPPMSRGHLERFFDLDQGRDP